MKRSKKITVADIPHVGRGTPAGEWFRRYWIVVSAARDLYDIPKAIKILGEDLVLFRDQTGIIGLIGEHCPHRGASLEYGDIECGWHSLSLSWLAVRRARSVSRNAGGTAGQQVCPEGKAFILSGARTGRLAVRLPGTEPGRSATAAEVRSACGLRRKRSLEATRVYDYNWFNFIENGADPAHFSILHRADPDDGTWRSWFFNFKDIPYFDAIEPPTA